MFCSFGHFLFDTDAKHCSHNAVIHTPESFSAAETTQTSDRMFSVDVTTSSSRCSLSFYTFQVPDCYKPNSHLRETGTAARGLT